MLKRLDQETCERADGSRVPICDRYGPCDPNTWLDYSLLAHLAHGLKVAGTLIRTRAIEPMRERARRRAALANLMQMSDYHLKDIGLSRSEIKAAVYGELPLDSQPSAVLSTGLPPRRRTAPARSAGRRSAKRTSGERRSAAPARLAGSRFPRPATRRRRRRTHTWQETAVWL